MPSERSRSRGPIVAVILLLVAGLAWWQLAGPGAGPDATDGSKAAADSSARGRLRLLEPPKIDRTALLHDLRSSISGTIRDEDGKPIPGARICVRASSLKLSDTQTRDSICVAGEPNGSYRVEGLMPVRYKLAAMAPSFIPAAYDAPGKRAGIQLQAGAHRDGVDVELEGGGVKIGGLVRDLTGGVIEGAQVVSTTGGGLWPEEDSAYMMVRTDADGRFELWVRARETAISAVAEGYAPNRDRGPAPGHVFEVLLTPESVLVGRVVMSGSNAPVEGARVHAQGSWNRRRRGGSTFTGADGKFRIDRLSPGRYKPVAETDEAFGMAGSGVELGLAETSETILLELHPAFAVEGAVTFTDGEACDQARVSLVDKTRDLRRSATADEAGSIRVKAVFPATYSVSVHCEGAIALLDYPNVVVEKQSVSGLQWTLTRGQAIRGVVVGPDGTPQARLSLSATLETGEARGQRTNGWDDSKKDGSFEFDGLLPGTYLIRVNDWGSALDHPSPEDPVEVVVLEGADTQDVRIELGAGAKIMGHVLDEQGSGVAGVKVRAAGQDSAWGQTTTSNDDGSYEIKALRPGRYRVTASKGWGQNMRAPGQTDDDIKGESVDIKVGDVAEVDLLVESKDGTINGRVVDEGGGPVADAFVSVRRESEAAGASAGEARRRVGSGGWRSGDEPVLSDMDGDFEMTSLAPGRYTVRAERRGGGEAIQEHVELGSTVELHIAVDGTVSGTVDLSGGGHPDRFSISLRDKVQGVMIREDFFRQDGGAFTVNGVPAGQYELTVSAPEGSGEVADLTVGEGEELRAIKVEIQGTGSVKGRLVGLADGEPIPDRMVIASGIGGGISVYGSDSQKGEHISGPDGSFFVENVHAGRVDLMAWPRNWESDKYARLYTTITVVAGQMTDLGDLRIPLSALEPNEKAGELGFTLADGDPKLDWSDRPLKVALVRPGGPAASGGLSVGATIVSVNGESVDGENRYLYGGLTRVTEGTTLTLGLKKGSSVTITAGPTL